MHGFQIEYNTLGKYTECGGSFTNASGALTSPGHPGPYPHAADCIYLVSQPIGTYINIYFKTMDIVCEEKFSTYDHIEMRDGNSEDSPTVGIWCGNDSNYRNYPTFIQTTQNHLWIR